MDMLKNILEESYNPMPEVAQYFKDFPIPKSLAKEVIEIYQDGSNDIYLQLICYAKDNALEDFKSLDISVGCILKI